MTKIAKIALIGREVDFTIMLLEANKRQFIDRKDISDNSRISQEIINKIKKAANKPQQVKLV